MIKNNLYTLIFILTLIPFLSNAQLFGKKGENNTSVESGSREDFDRGVQQARIDSRAKLLPYKYDGTKSTHFSYKTFTHVREVEILTIENTDYKFCFDGTMIKLDNIKLEIYDKPLETSGRVLLFEKSDVGPGEFEVSLEDMNETFRKKRLEYLTKPAASDKAAMETYQSQVNLIGKMRLKKIYLNYIIPAVERKVSVDQYGEEDVESRSIQFSAIVVAIGYKYL